MACRDPVYHRRRQEEAGIIRNAAFRENTTLGRTAVFTMARSRLIQAHPSLTRPTRLESSHLPNLYAIMNDRINRMGPEQYPPSPALVRNENPPYPRLIGTDD